MATASLRDCYAAAERGCGRGCCSARRLARCLAILLAIFLANLLDICHGHLSARCEAVVQDDSLAFFLENFQENFLAIFLAFFLASITALLPAVHHHSPPTSTQSAYQALRHVAFRALSLEVLPAISQASLTNGLPDP